VRAHQPCHLGILLLAQGEQVGLRELGRVDGNIFSTAGKSQRRDAWSTR
jgi:hypothetical protein